MQTHKMKMHLLGRITDLRPFWLHRYTLSCCLVRARPALFIKLRLHLSFIISRAPENYVQSVLMVTQLTHTTLDHSASRNPEATE